MQRHGYIGEFEIIDDKRSGKIVVELNGRLNKCGVISPRYDLKLKVRERGAYVLELRKDHLQDSAISSVWIYPPHHHPRYHGPQGGQTQTSRR